MVNLQNILQDDWKQNYLSSGTLKVYLGLTKI